MRTSLGGIGQMIVAMTSWIFLMRILAAIGSEAVAGATIAIRIMMFTMMPAWGMSNAAATLVGQNLGAQQPDRAEAAVWRIGAYNMVYLGRGVGGVLRVARASSWASSPTEPAVIAIGAEWLRILSYSLFVYGWWMVSVQAFNGAGDTVTPTWINVVFFWLIQIPLCVAAGGQARLAAHRGVLGRVRLGDLGRPVHAVDLQSRQVESGHGLSASCGPQGVHGHRSRRTLCLDPGCRGADIGALDPAGTIALP